MDWLGSLRTVLRYIEERLDTELDVAEAAKSVGLSPFYLQRGFHVLTGYTLGEYIRCRRLSEAARELTQPGTKVIDVALKYGYDTPESFSKAFSRFHGATPAAVKRGAQPRSFLPLQIRIEITGGDKMDYTLSPMEGFTLIGFERRFRSETAYAELPQFWDELSDRYFAALYAGREPADDTERAVLANRVGEYGVCIDDGEDGPFRYLIAGRYTGGSIPEGMRLVELPAGDWAKFRCVGKMPEALQSLNTQIFREWLPGNPDCELRGGYNVEWYSQGDMDSPDYESGIWLPVKKKE